MGNYNNIPNGLLINSQINLNPKVSFDTLAELIDLGVDDVLAFTYYNNMYVFCAETEKIYIWKEITEVAGIIVGNFTYPPNYVSFGFDYSNKIYNFYIVKLGNSTGLEAIEEGNGIGWRLIGRDPDNYGNIGLNAVDFSISTIISILNGSTGKGAITYGENNANPYIDTIIFGKDAIGNSTNQTTGFNLLGGEVMRFYNNLYNSFGIGFKSFMGTVGAAQADSVIYECILVGHNCNMYAGRGSAMFGQALLGGSVACLIVGVANRDLTESIANYLTADFNNYGARFIVGVGDWNPVSNGGTRKNGFVVMSDGVISAPELSIAKINNPIVPANASANFANRLLVTKEWVNFKNLVSKTAAYIITVEDYTIECTANSFPVTLPSAIGIKGKIFNINNTGIGTITVNTTSSQIINGDLTQTVNQWENLQVQSNGTNWIIL